MSKAYVLLDLYNDATAWRKERATQICNIMVLMGLHVIRYGETLCKEEEAENLETQMGVKDGKRESFIIHAADSLVDQVVKGDLIVATEAWHTKVFKGLLDAADGKYASVPVLEVGIDYQYSFAKWRIFANQFTRAWEACSSRQPPGKVNLNWLVARPAYVAEKTNAALTECKLFYADPFSMEHMDYIRRGIPVVAPDWGVWAETIEHGKTGCLYRTEAGRDNALKHALTLPSAVMLQRVTELYSEDNALAQVQGFISRVLNA